MSCHSVLITFPKTQEYILFIFAFYVDIVRLMVSLLWLCCSWNKLLVRLAGGELAPRLSLVSPKVFSPFCHRWSFRSLPLSPLACLVGDTSFPAQSSTWFHRYYLNWTKLDNAITKFNNEMHSADNWVLNPVILHYWHNFAYFDIVQCFVTICIVKSAI